MPRPALRDEKSDQEQEPTVAALFEALTAGLPVDDGTRSLANAFP